MNPSSPKPPAHHHLDALTEGAFSAPTSGERAARVRQWLASSPSTEELHQVFKELSARDKGAAKPVRERLDELKRAKDQESLSGEWAARGTALLELGKLNIADALAWQRDAAKAGAPLSREPLTTIKTKLAERVKGVEDLQHRVMVQREAAVLLAQRVEMLGTKALSDAMAAHEALGADLAVWQNQAAALLLDANWNSIDVKFPPLLDASRTQLLAVWEAFEAAMGQARTAVADATAALPAVPAWAEELRAARLAAADASAAAAQATRPAKPKIDPEVRAQASAAVKAAMELLESEMEQGHGKASVGAANSLRNALREQGRLIDDRLEARAHAALAAAGELEGWQRWRADQLREELVAKAEGLLNRPEGQALGGRKMQESLRTLREQWKQTDQGGAPNQALWKRFDEACGEAYKVVLAWIERIKTQAAEQRALRLALIEELKAWGAEHAGSTDWKLVLRGLNHYSDRWQQAGHLGEKAVAELQALWDKAIEQAATGLEAERARSLAQRQAMIDEATALGNAPDLRVDAVRALQQRWQAEAQTVPLERRQEQKLWDSFRKPIDDAFQRKTLERERAQAQRVAQMSAQDRSVLEASKRLDEASLEGDAQKVRAATQALQAALRGEIGASAMPAPKVQTGAVAPVQGEETVQPSAEGVKDTPPDGGTSETADASKELQSAAGSAADAEPSAAPPTPVAAPAKPTRPVVAVRGDDRPGMKRTEPAGTGARPGGRSGFGDRGAERAGRKPDGRSDDFGRGQVGRPGRDGPRFGDSRPAQDRGPRLGEEAFRAQREALERAEATLRKLAAQAHGEVVTGLLGAWEKRDPDLLPNAQALGRAVSAGVRTQWAKALRDGATSNSEQAMQCLIRLEVGAELPTPGEHQAARRAMQLLLLTQRNQPTPAQTWPEDIAKLLACPYEPGYGGRAQTILKALLRR